MATEDHDEEMDLTEGVSDQSDEEPPEIMKWDNEYNQLHQDPDFELTEAMPVFVSLEELIKHHLKHIGARIREKTLHALDEKHHELQKLIQNKDSLDEGEIRGEMEELVLLEI